MYGKNNSYTPKIILFIFVYLVFTAVMATINILDVRIPLWHSYLDVSDSSMIITMLLTIWLIINIITFRKAAYDVSHILFFVHICVIFMAIVVTRSIKTIPGLLTVAFMYIVSMVIYKHLSTIDTKDMELKKIAYTDQLTHTPNRSAFNELIADLVNDTEAEDNNFALVFVDINEFTHINDAAGHEYGDKVLKEIVARWKYTMESDDFIARLGGDEFALIIRGFSDKNELIEHVKKFSAALKNKITIDDQSVFVSASFGIAVFPQDSTNSEELLRYSNIAMQAARTSNDTNICLFESSMTDSVEYELNIENLLREAIINDRFKLVFQPQYDTETKRLRGFETLLRMTDAGGKPISPGVFIPMAESNGLIVDIDCYVLKKAMEIFLPMLKKYNDKLILSVNISAIHLAKNSFISDVKNALEYTGFPPQNLEIEITESVFISSLESTADILAKIKEMGIQIALDDFGTGYASLSYLTKLPIDLLKIDKTFVDGLQQESNFSDFVAAIISMGHLLHFDVISEGVEYEEQLNTLKKLKCDFIQGFLWGRPMDIDSVDTLLKAL